MLCFHSHIHLRRAISVAVLLAVLLLLLATPLAWAGGNHIGANVGQLFKHYASQLYGGLAAITGVIFLWNRRYVELATFVLAAIVVGWLVFAPSSIGSAAEAIAHQIFG